MKLYLFFMVLVAIVAVTLGWRSFRLIFVDFPFEANKDYVDMRLEIQNTTGETAINCHLNVLEDLDDVTFAYAILLQQPDGNYTTFVKRSLHFCKFLKNKSINQPLKIFYEELSKYGNFFKSCPITKGAYFFKDFRLDEEMMPSYVPEIGFAIEIEFAMSKKPTSLFKGILHGRVDKEKGFNNLKVFSMG